MSENIFSKINVGKIDLTDSELIKASLLFNVKEDENSQINNLTEQRKREITHIRQVEISNEWDKIEQDLQNDKFWKFITNEQQLERINRIEYIFDYIAKRNYNSPDFYTFNTIKDKIESLKNDKNDVKEELWSKEVKKVYRLLKEWYEDTELYNLIGFLNFCNIKIEDINNNDNNFKEDKTATQYLLDKFLNNSNNDSNNEIDNNSNFYINKEDFKESVREIVRNKIEKDFNLIEQEDINISNLDVDQIAYDKNSKGIKRLLIFFNILTLNKLNKKFAFDVNTFEQWEIEHIWPQNIEEMKNDTIEEWCKIEEKTIESYIDEFKSDKKKVKEYNIILNKLRNVNKDKNKFEEISSSLYTMLESENGKKGINTIANLALIDRNTNSKFSNHFFDTKRLILIQIEKGETQKDNIKNGQIEEKIPYSPICTRNVFLKFYSENPKSLHFWTDEDRVAYKKEIVKTIKNFMKIKEV